MTQATSRSLVQPEPLSIQTTSGLLAEILLSVKTFKSHCPKLAVADVATIKWSEKAHKGHKDSNE